MTNVLTLPQISGSLTIATNADLRVGLQFSQVGSNAPLDLTGIVFHMQVRPAAGNPVVVLDLSTNNNTLINGGTNGLLSWLVPKSPSIEQLTPGSYVADLIAEADGATINLCQAGPLTVTVVEGLTC
jgi:hypothetical protein